VLGACRTIRILLSGFRDNITLYNPTKCLLKTSSNNQYYNRQIDTEHQYSQYSNIALAPNLNQIRPILCYHVLFILLDHLLLHFVYGFFIDLTQQVQL
jgi:hypothetical protein